MADIAAPRRAASLGEVTPSLKKRRAAEARFKAYGIAAISVALFFLIALLSTVFVNGISAFQQTSIRLTVDLKQDVIDPQGRNTVDAVMTGNVFRWGGLVDEALLSQLGIDPNDELLAADAQKLLSGGSRILLRDYVAENLDQIGTRQEIWFLADGVVDAFMKGSISEETEESRRPIKDRQIAMLRQLEEAGALEKKFNTGLFTFGASSRAETAGVGAAMVGSMYMMLVVLALALPIGVAASIYLEEFAPKNRWTDLIEVNINNLAAVPSIVFGILGLAVFINFFGLPRSAALVGGLVLTLMTLPTIIIATRASLKAVPPSIREAALGVGASKMQAVFHHVLPLAMPGILTGTIIGLAQALGETAPLLMIGMVAFIADVPSGPTDPATALPVQIFMWANMAERAFVERTSAAIIVLLGFLLIMNVTAILLRKRFERRW
ncbi:MAG: phosphate ABC transporter permease PstA [Pikeienuella sp.]|uniref:phosphate ABC transporter permease PstA n=1 Tax=Pikeienuella sp. TaxID=2831957 RepID=UPI00391B5F3A